jgi:Putative zinc-finger
MRRARPEPRAEGTTLSNVKGSGSVTIRATPETERRRAMGDGQLTCKELVELVTDYLEDALSTGDRERFEEHLATCSACRAHLDQMHRTIEVLGRLPEEALPPDAERDLLDAFRTWQKG